MFSSRCRTDDVPGIRSTLGATLSVQANATCAGVRPSLSLRPAHRFVSEHLIRRRKRRSQAKERHATLCRAPCIRAAPAPTTGRPG